MKRVALLISIASIVIGVFWIGGGAAGTQSRFDRHRVKVFFTTQESIDDTCKVTQVRYRWTTGTDVLHDAMNWLLRGPRQGEQDEGLVSFFSRRTSGMVNSVRIDEGTALIDFDDFRRIIPGASSSCGSASLLAELDRTAKQFPRVDHTLYSFEGRVESFYNWLQIEPPQVNE